MKCLPVELKQRLLRFYPFGFILRRREPLTDQNGRKSMPELQPRYSKEEFAQRGDEIYERDICPQIDETSNAGKFVAIDIETGAYEIDVDELTASDRLLARYPEAQIWLRRVGSRYVRRFRPHQCSDRLSHVTSG